MATATKKPWADGPYQLIPSSIVGSKKGEIAKGSRSIAEEMVNVHNMILRIINSIYLQCVNVGKSPNPDDVKDFVAFAREWSAMVHEHHDTEEKAFFPAIEEKAGVPGLMDNNVAQHKAFHDGLTRYDEYLNGVEEGKEVYDGAKFKGIIHSFMPLLQKHLAEEIETLLQLEKYEDRLDWAKWMQEFQAELLKHAMDDRAKTTLVPLILTNRDRTWEDGMSNWPPLPWFANLLMKWVFIPKRSNLWRFSCCDSSGSPRELPFA